MRLVSLRACFVPALFTLACALSACGGGSGGGGGAIGLPGTGTGPTTPAPPATPDTGTKPELHCAP